LTGNGDFYVAVSYALQLARGGLDRLWRDRQCVVAEENITALVGR